MTPTAPLAGHQFGFSAQGSQLLERLFVWLLEVFRKKITNLNTLKLFQGKEENLHLSESPSAENLLQTNVHQYGTQNI